MNVQFSGWPGIFMQQLSVENFTDVCLASLLESNPSKQTGEYSCESHSPTWAYHYWMMEREQNCNIWQTGLFLLQK